MISQKLQILNKLGLHARASAKLVQTSSKFISHIEISKEGLTVNCKSIMGVMMLAASQHSWVELNVNGEDEQAAMEAIQSLIADRFGEAK